MKRFYLSRLMIAVVLLLGWDVHSFAQSSTFAYSGAAQYYTVPAGVTSLAIDMQGGRGGNSEYSGTFGGGGRVQCQLVVTSGQVLQINVGGVGTSYTFCCTYNYGGWNGGGYGYYYSGGGGGMSDIRSGAYAFPANALVVAGGGGGGGADCNTDLGGAGGGLTGGNGTLCGSYQACESGSGGTQTSGGASGTCTSWSGGPGTPGVGGNCWNGYYYSGGGGAGWEGGGGAFEFGGGGGGSSYTSPTLASNVTHTQGYNVTGNGVVSICPGPIVGTITGAASVCPGGATTTLTDVGGVAGGVWTSSTPAKATINASTGLVTGILTGTTTISYTVTSACTSGSALYTLTISPKPTAYDVINGGTFCAGSGPGVDVSTDGSDIGTKYQLYSGSSPVGAAKTGTGSPIDFLLQPAGTYTVTATITSTGCSLGMLGSATVTSLPLPNVYTVTAALGGSSTSTGTIKYCVGSAAPHIQLNTSDAGISYQLNLAGAPIDTPRNGSGGLIDFGPRSLTGTYTITATNALTSCTVNMTGNPTIGTNPLPTAYSLTGGGHFCSLGVGVPIGLINSASGIRYQLYDGFIAEGSPVLGNSGLAISFGLHTDTGSYTVVATDTAKLCVNNMTGTEQVVSDPLPNVYTITGGGSYCAGPGGSDIKLNGSDLNVSYQLYIGGSTPSGIAKLGTGGIIDFGTRTASGAYTVVGTSTSATHCTNNMAGSVNITINPLPAIDTVMGGGGYCEGGAGKAITLSFSNTGVNYQLYIGGTNPVGTVQAGTGFPLSFGVDTAGGTYTVRATNATTGCNSNMFGSATITVNQPPTAYLVGGAGSYCSLGTGLPVTVAKSDTGVSYQLYNMGTIIPGEVAPGTGGLISFPGQTLAGAYTVVATTVATTCTNIMTGSANMTINPLPLNHNVTGGGGFCAGSTGLPVGLDGSDSSNITYTLLDGGVAVPGAPVLTGTNGGPLNFGIYTGTGTYTIHASNSTTTCNVDMSGNATITINPPPTAYPVSVAGTGNFCIGSATGLDVYLPSSASGVNYQLFSSSVMVGGPVSGSGGLIHFGIQPAGNYTVVGTNIISSCVTNMTGSVNVIGNLPPAAFTVTGGGGFCPGISGSDVGLNGSVSGVSYAVYNGLTPTGITKVGSTGHSIDFGNFSGTGVYTIIGTAATTGCATTMTGSDSIYTDLLPTPYTVTGGGPYCMPGGLGSDVGLNLSDTGVTYSLFLGGVPTGTNAIGTGGPADFGLLPLKGTYTVLATDNNTHCINNMTGSAIVSTVAAPAVFTVSGGGTLCQGAPGYFVTLSGSQVNVSYLLSNGTLANVAGTGKPINYGLQNISGAYTVMATDNITGCTSSMASGANIVVNTLPNIDTVTGGGNYCSGAVSSLHVGLNTADVGFRYQLYLSGSAVGGALPGKGTPLDFGVQSAGGTYTVIASNITTSCSDTMNKSASIVVNPVAVPSITTATPATVVCAGTQTTFTTTAANTGLAPTYMWFVNGVSVPGATSDSYTDTSLNADIVSVQMTSNAACATPHTALSNMVAMTVNPVTTPSTTLLLDPPGDSVCAGTSVQYTAVAAHAGLAPTYSWTQNGIPTGTTVDNTMIISGSGTISVVVTSSDPCVMVGDSAVTASVNMTVVPQADPVLAALSVTPGKTIVAGQIDTVTATITSGGGTNPVYEWQINGITVPGQTTNRLIGNNLINGVVFNNHDSVTCIVTGTGMCGGSSASRSATITIRNTTSVNQVTSALSDIRVVPNPNKGMFSIKGNLGTTDDQSVELEVSDMLGQIVYKNTVTAVNGNLNEQVQLSKSLANGMYILNVRSGTENSAFHFVIEQ